MTILSSVPASFSLGFQRSNSRTEIPAVFTLKNVSSSNILPPAPSTFRFGKAVSLQGRRRPTVLPASENNPSDQGTVKEKANSGTQGPPFLTILAGLVVFLFLCWIVGSIVMWLISLIVNAPSS